MPEFNAMTDMVPSLSTRLLGRSLVPTQPGVVSVQDIVSLANVPDVSDFLTQAEIEALIPDVSEFLTQAEIEALPGFGGGSALYIKGWDTIIVEYVSPISIKLLAGGQLSLPSGSMLNLASDISLSLASDLSADDTLASDKWYHVISNGTTFKLSIATSCSDVANGIPLKAGISTYDNLGVPEIRMFRHDSLWYQYLDSILLYSATMPTTNTAIDLSAYVPAGVRGLWLRSSSLLNTSARVNTSAACIFINDIATHEGDHADGTNQTSAASGVFRAMGGRSINFRCAYAYAGGNLWLQGWKI